MESGEDFLIRPVEQGFALAFASEGIMMIGIFACEEEDEGDACEEGEDDYNRDKCSHGESPFLFYRCTEEGGKASPVFGF